MNKTFAKALSELFTVLQQWRLAEPLSLTLSASIGPLYSEEVNYLGEEGLTSGYLRLFPKYQKSGHLPSVPALVKLHVLAPLDGSTSLHIASKLPNLTDWTTGIEDRICSAPHRRLDCRLSLAQQLSTSRLPGLRKIAFYLDHVPPRNHSFRVPRATESHCPQDDELSRALRAFLQQSPCLESIEIGSVFGASITPSFFWPSDDERAAAPRWPALQKLVVHISAVAPDGTWLFVGRGCRGREVGGGADGEDAVDSGSGNDECYGSDDSSFSSRLGEEYYYFPDNWREVYSLRAEREYYYSPDNWRERYSSRANRDRAIAETGWPVNAWRQRPHMGRVQPLFVAAAKAAAAMPRLRALQVTLQHNVPCAMTFAAARERLYSWSGDRYGWRVEASKDRGDLARPKAVAYTPRGYRLQDSELRCIWKASKGPETGFVAKEVSKWASRREPREE